MYRKTERLFVALFEIFLNVHTEYTVQGILNFYSSSIFGGPYNGDKPSEMLYSMHSYSNWNFGNHRQCVYTFGGLSHMLPVDKSVCTEPMRQLSFLSTTRLCTYKT
ncbi:hypothetical protein AVEN_101072-1 [Araneus ventricosus]|uniref:Uncharacterized protein n=1 Tax=Araneus ventricosus TaxID=182803 RepID=A0A4Y2TWQ6_ARAVE|nr:hypothetical protein AVEN_101072-1 [Araneus ventricosus]